MANYKVPRVVAIVDELPVNATGKVMKDALRQQAGSHRGRGGGVSADAAPGLTALAGLRVVELGVWVAAPSAAALLADWGADVIKVESPAGDPMRQVFGSLGIESDMPNPAFALDNRGKRSVSLDLRRAGGPTAPRATCWTRPTCSSATSGPTPSTASAWSRRPPWPAIRGWCTAASAGTASGATSGTAPPTTSGPSGPGPACRCRWPTPRAIRSTPEAASATTSPVWPHWPASWPRCWSSGRPDVVGSSRCRSCGPAPTCSGGTWACR